MTDAEFQNRLAEYEDMVRLLTAKLEELAAENTRLRSEKKRRVCSRAITAAAMALTTILEVE
jgi:hypothetical protein